MGIYELDGKIGINPISLYFVTSDEKIPIDQLYYFYGETDFSEISEGIDYTLRQYGIWFPWTKVKLPYLTETIPEELLVAFPNIYKANLSSGLDVNIAGVSIGTLTIDGTTIEIDGQELLGFPYLFSTSNAITFEYYFSVLSENSINNGNISAKGNPINTLFIQITRYDNGNWMVSVRLQDIFSGICTKSLLDGTKPSEYIETDDPFNPGGSTDAGGGDGSFDNTSTPVDIPPLPSISASDTGFISIYNPTITQLNELASYMWSGLFDIDGWRKIFADPMDAILGLSILPVRIPTSGTKEVMVGNISTGISLSLASQQFVEVDCGEINVNEYWGAYLDYEPYTQAQIFLPYIGTRPISVDEIMEKTVKVVYHVDILTGACTCFVKCGESVLYTYNGQCSIPIPITSANYTSVVNGVISVAASIGSMVATGGATAPTAIPSIASSVVNQMKPSIEKSGSISGSAGILNMQTPYLILIRPRQALPSKQNEFIGYPSLITVQLAELAGYTEVQSIHLENIPATQEELTEIQSLLEGGVIF